MRIHYQTILIHMLKYFTHMPPRLIALIVVCLIIVAGVGYALYHSASGSVDRYTVYATLAEEHEQAAYLVGAANNPVRQELNQVLSEALARPMTSSERLQLAEHGKELLKEAEGQIDMIGELGAKVDTAIAQMQVGALGEFSSSDIAREVLVLAKKRSDIIADIRGLSYRANFETAKIFDRVIADGGKLTKEHISMLNDEIPDVEKQFDRRSDLYLELQRTAKQIDQRSVDLGGVWKGTR